VGHAARLARAAVVLAVSAAYFAQVFRVAQGTWLRAGLGDWMDPYLLNAILEQWNYSVWHLTDPTSPPVFFPATSTLGYSVSLILYAPFYLAVRPWLHPFAAYSLTLFLVMETGAWCLYAIFRRFLALGFLESLLLTALFCTSGNVINGYSGTWSQVASVFLIPPILLLGLVSARRPAGRVAWLGAFLTGLLAVLVFAQDFYTGVLALLIAMLLLAGARLLFRWPSAGGLLRIVEPGTRLEPGLVRLVSSWIALLLAVIGACWTWIVTHDSLLGIPLRSRHHHAARPALVALAAFVAFSYLRGGIVTKLRVTIPPFSSRVVAFAAGALMGGLVFLWIYLGPFLEHNGFSGDEIMRSIQPRDLSGWRHPVDLVRSLVPYESGRALRLVFITALLVWIPWFHVNRRTRLGSLWFLFVSVFVVLVGLQLGGFSLWTTFFAFLPGLAAIRDPKRIIFAYELAVALATGVFLAQLPRRSLLRISIGGLVAVLLIADWNPATFVYRRPMEVFDQYVQAPIAIDPSCRSFFIRRASPAYASRSDDMRSLYGLDAVFIATKHGVPTLNGYSAWGPSGWGLAVPPDAGYADGVARWVAEHRLRGVCALDIDARTMTPYGPSPARN
jgi:hypothetical protein